MVKPAVCPMKPKTSCPKRVSHKKKTRTDSIRNSNYRLTGEELHELRRLAQILPTTMRTSNPQNDPLQLLHSARQYINQLNATLMARVQNGTISQEVLSNLPLAIMMDIQQPPNFPNPRKLNRTSASTRRR